MKQEILLHKLLNLAGEIQFSGDKARAEHKKNKKYHKSDEHKGEHKAKKHHKMSPVTKNILLWLIDEESLNQRSLAKRCKVTGQAVSESLKKMEEKELILRTQGEINNENIITLTEKGKVKALELRKKMQEKANKLFEDFSETELDTLLNLLEKLQEKQSEIVEITDKEVKGD